MLGFWGRQKGSWHRTERNRHLAGQEPTGLQLSHLRVGKDTYWRHWGRAIGARCRLGTTSFWSAEVWELQEQSASSPGPGIGSISHSGGAAPFVDGCQRQGQKELDMVTMAAESEDEEPEAFWGLQLGQVGVLFARSARRVPGLLVYPVIPRKLGGGVGWRTAESWKPAWIMLSSRTACAT